MKILFITNYFPPSKNGWGYMQLCEEVADGLADKGHQIVVLTSTDGDGPEYEKKYPVKRWLTIDPDWHGEKSAAVQFYIGRLGREKRAVHRFHQLVGEFLPDVVFVWHAIGLPRALLQAAERMLPTVYYLAGYLPELPDEYIAYWESEPSSRWAKIIKKPLARISLMLLRYEGKPIPLRYDHVICVSKYVRRRLVDKNMIPKESVVIHNGVDLSVFTPAYPPRQIACGEQVACLVAGRLVPEKGVHTVIDAFALLGERVRKFRLTILGDGEERYIQELQARVHDNRLDEYVSFASPVPRIKMPQFLRQYDVLVLPSEYEEPLARSMQEAMAVGLLVIGTTTGGSGELLVNEHTGMVFEAGNALSLTRQLERVLFEYEHVQTLAQTGQKMVHELFNIHLTIDKIEQYLLNVLKKYVYG